MTGAEGWTVMSKNRPAPLHTRVAEAPNSLIPRDHKDSVIKQLKEGSASAAEVQLVKALVAQASGGAKSSGQHDSETQRTRGSRGGQQRPNAKGGSGRVCFLCGETGHIAANCPCKATPKRAQLQSWLEAAFRDKGKAQVRGEAEAPKAPQDEDVTKWVCAECGTKHSNDNKLACRQCFRPRRQPIQPPTPPPQGEGQAERPGPAQAATAAAPLTQAAPGAASAEDDPVQKLRAFLETATDPAILKAAQDIKLVPTTPQAAAPETDSDKHAKLKRLCDKRSSLGADIRAAAAAVQAAQDELRSLTKAREIIEEDYKALYKTCGPAQGEDNTRDVRMAEAEAAAALPTDCMEVISRMEAALGATDTLCQAYDAYATEVTAAQGTPEQPAAWLAAHTRKELHALRATVQGCAKVAQYAKRRRVAAAAPGAKGPE